MKYTVLRRIGLLAGTLVSTAGLAAAPASALSSLSSTNSSTTGSTTASSKLVQLIISRGNTEISRRLTTLNTLDSKISSATKLSADDQSTLSGEVNNEISGLTSLKTTLDGETQAANAKTDAQSVINGYRVYALVVPKVWLVKTADDQQATESKLSDLATKIQSDITADQNAGKNVAGLQAKLSDMTSKIQAAQGISSSIETKVVGLQPTDYNSDHTVLSGDRDQLKTAQGDISAATTDAKSLIGSLRTL